MDSESNANRSDKPTRTNEANVQETDWDEADETNPGVDTKETRRSK